MTEHDAPNADGQDEEANAGDSAEAGDEPQPSPARSDDSGARDTSDDAPSATVMLTGPDVLGPVIDKSLGSIPDDFVPLAAADVSGSAVLLAQISKTLPWPRAVWASVDPEHRRRLAQQYVECTIDERCAAAQAARWALEPDASLMSLLKSGNAVQGNLAERILLARAGVSDFQIERARARTEVVRKTASLMEAVVKDRDTWRKLAGTAKGLLIATIVVSIAVLAYVLLKLANDDGFDEWTIPVIIFALAVFAASPAALLLLERPLKGVDNWMPGAIQATAGDGAAGAAGATDGTGTTNSAGTSTNQSGAASYSKGPGKPD